MSSQVVEILIVGSLLRIREKTFMKSQVLDTVRCVSSYPDHEFIFLQQEAFILQSQSSAGTVTGVGIPWFWPQERFSSISKTQLSLRCGGALLISLPAD